MGTNTERTVLANDDSRGSGRLVVLLPGAGDLRAEYRFLVPQLVAAGYRVVAADLPGHGESAPAGDYTVASTADAVAGLIDSLDAGPAVVVAASFAPAAAVWAAVEHPGSIDAIVAISPHFHADPSLKGRLQGAALSVMLRGPWAAGVWAKLYRGWYKASPPADLPSEIAGLRAALADPSQRRAFRQTLTAGRDGVAERMSRLDIPTLTVFGSSDDHFADPAAEAVSTARQLKGEHLIIEGAGHYPHVEQPDQVGKAILVFLGENS